MTFLTSVRFGVLISLSYFALQDETLSSEERTIWEVRYYGLWRVVSLIGARLPTTVGVMSTK